MSKQEVDIALSDLDTALDIIRDQCRMPVSGYVYPFYQSARASVERAKKALDNLHEHPYKNDTAPRNAEITSCQCATTPHPPCSWCENGGGGGL